MNNTEELLNEILLKKRGLSLVMDNQNITTHDIMNTFYRQFKDAQNLGIEHFQLYDYHVVFGDFITGIQYTENDKTYYMMIGANSPYAPPQQIAVGTTVGKNIYMMSETFPNPSSIDFIVFPKFAINQRIKGFVPKSYRDTIRLFSARQSVLSDESIKCLECGFESIESFCSLINQIKNQDKRKKLKI